MKKKYLIYTLLPLFVVTLLMADTSYATSTGFSKGNPGNMEKNRPQKFNQIAQAVANGKLTQAQADLINNKRAENRKVMDNQREKMRNMTPAEREVLIKTQADAMKKWASDNSIPEEYAPSCGGYGNGGEGRGLGRYGFNKGT